MLIFRLFVALLLGLCASAAQAQDRLPGWQAALDSGSDRLALYALARSDHPEAGAAVRALTYRVGGGHRGHGLQRLAAGRDLRPILRYTGNFNGGIPGDTLRVGGLDFIIDEDARAKSGLVAGGGVQGLAMYSYASGSRLILQAEAEASALITNGMWRVDAGTRGCVQHRLREWNWLDGCIGLSAERRSYDSDLVERSFSFGPTRLFTFGGVDQQAHLQFHYRDRSDYAQPSLALNWIAAVPDLGAIGIDARVAATVRNQNTMLRSLSLSLARPILDRPTRIGLQLGETGGDALFGTPREDRILGLSLSAPLRQGLFMDAQAARTNSTVDIYDETAFAISFRLTD